MNKQSKKERRGIELIMELTGSFWGVCMALRERGVPQKRIDEMVSDFNIKMAELKELYE